MQSFEQVRVAIEDPLDWPQKESLEALNIEELYQLLEEGARQRSTIQAITETVRGQISLMKELGQAIWNIRGGKVDHQEANQIIQKHEQAFLHTLQAAGLRIQYESEVSTEELKQKPALFLATHQGGGGENYIHQAITGETGRLVVKDSLFKIPYIREGLEGRKAVPVKRAMLKESETRIEEIERIATEVVGQLASGGNMYIFFEGTRSRNGEIASSEKRRAWAKDMINAIDRLWAEQQEGSEKPREFQKLLLVFNTMTAMPDAPEEKIFRTRFRTTGTTLSAKLVKADDLKLEESDNQYDPTTLFGKARTELKKMLVKIILEQEA